MDYGACGATSYATFNRGPVNFCGKFELFCEFLEEKIGIRPCKFFVVKRAFFLENFHTSVM
jgi:hypothetical protein